MPRCLRLLIAFDGGGYQGWQRQAHGPTVQGELERALTTLCAHPVTVHGAGRTDAGVHALGMVAHFHTATTIPVAAFSKALNGLLPTDIRILAAEEAEVGFNVTAARSLRSQGNCHLGVGQSAPYCVLKVDVRNFLESHALDVPAVHVLAVLSYQVAVLFVLADRGSFPE